MSVLNVKAAGVVAVSLLLVSSLYGQDLPTRLLQPASYSPKATSTLEALIEVAQHYRIPMGIEWIQDSKAEGLPLSPEIKPLTVQDLIVGILQRSSGYVAQQSDGVLHIAKAEYLDSRENFLNLRIPDFEVQDEELFGAEASLRRSILLKLHPELYGRGSNGGYGYGVPRDDGFDKRVITFAGSNLTVREILNKIATANGNALWVVQLVPSQKMSHEPFFAQASLIDGRTMPDFHWKFIPLQVEKITPQTPN